MVWFKVGLMVGVVKVVVGLIGGCSVGVVLSLMDMVTSFESLLLLVLLCFFNICIWRLLFH